MSDINKLLAEAKERVDRMTPSLRLKRTAGELSALGALTYILKHERGDDDGMAELGHSTKGWHKLSGLVRRKAALECSP